MASVADVVGDACKTTIAHHEQDKQRAAESVYLEVMQSKAEYRLTHGVSIFSTTDLKNRTISLHGKTLWKSLTVN